MKKYIIVTCGILFVGCASNNNPMYWDKLKENPNPNLLHIDRLAEKPPVVEPEELKKGPASPGRVIDYKGHGLGYTSHMQHYLHLQHIHGPACDCHLHRR